jgi:hypothetical protein
MDRRGRGRFSAIAERFVSSAAPPAVDDFPNIPICALSVNLRRSVEAFVPFLFRDDIMSWPVPNDSAASVVYLLIIFRSLFGQC